MSLPDGYVVYVECDSPIDGDGGEHELEVGDSVYPLRCDYMGDVAQDIDWSRRVAEWICPRCGTRHEEMLGDPRDWVDPF